MLLSVMLALFITGNGSWWTL